MDLTRMRLVAATLMWVFVAYAGTNLALDRTARWVEVEQDGYLWWTEEWIQLFGANNFVDRGGDRILLSGSSEVREGFLFDEFEAELPGFDVFNNAFSNHTLETLLIVLRYIETTYGPAAMPRMIVLGVTPLFLLDYPPLERSYLPRVIDRYSPFVSLDIESRPARLIPKGGIESLLSRYEYLTHQSRRYKGAVRGVARWAALAVAPSLADRPWMRRGLVPSKYHHLEPIDQREQLQALRRVLPPPPDPVAVAETVRAQWAMLRELAADHDIGLYVVSMPQSTLMREDYFADIYGEYRRLLRSMTRDVPFLDLSQSLRDDEFYDLTHISLDAARRTSRRVARFVHATGVAAHRGSRPGEHSARASVRRGVAPVDHDVR